MGEILYGSVWNMITLLLTTYDVVKSTYNGSLLECGGQMEGTGRHLFLVVEDGTTVPGVHTHSAKVAESDYGRDPQVWASSSSGRDATRRTRHSGYDLLHRYTIAISGNQTTEAQLYQAGNTCAYPWLY